MLGFGIQTAATVAGGSAPSFPGRTNTAFEYDGSSWTAAGNININRQYGAGAGTQEDGIIFGGDTGPAALANTEAYDGTSWVSGVSMAQKRRYFPGDGATSTAALAFGGEGPPTLNSTEEYTAGTTAINTKTLTTS